MWEALILPSNCGSIWLGHFSRCISFSRLMWSKLYENELLNLLYIHSSSRPGSLESSVDGVCSTVSVSLLGSLMVPEPTFASTLTSTAAAFERMRPSSASLRAKRAISESYSSHSGMARARASFGSFCRLVSRGARFSTGTTYGQWILAKIYSLGTMESILATCLHITMRTMTKQMSNDSLTPRLAL